MSLREYNAPGAFWNELLIGLENVVAGLGGLGNWEAGKCDQNGRDSRRIALPENKLSIDHSPHISLPYPSHPSSPPLLNVPHLCPSYSPKPTPKPTPQSSCACSPKRPNQARRLARPARRPPTLESCAARLHNHPKLKNDHISHHVRPSMAVWIHATSRRMMEMPG